MGMAAKAAYLSIKATMALPKIIMSLDPWLSGVTLAGMTALAAWQMIPAVRVFVPPIYMEWIVCLATFFFVAVVDKEIILAEAIASKSAA